MDDFIRELNDELEEENIEEENLKSYLDSVEEKEVWRGGRLARIIDNGSTSTIKNASVEDIVKDTLFYIKKGGSVKDEILKEAGEYMFSKTASKKIEMHGDTNWLSLCVSFKGEDFLKSKLKEFKEQTNPNKLKSPRMDAVIIAKYIENNTELKDALDYANDIKDIKNIMAASYIYEEMSEENKKKTKNLINDEKSPERILGIVANEGWKDKIRDCSKDDMLLIGLYECFAKKTSYENHGTVYDRAMSIANRIDYDGSNIENLIENALYSGPKDILSGDTLPIYISALMNSTTETDFTLDMRRIDAKNLKRIGYNIEGKKLTVIGDIGDYAGSEMCGSEMTIIGSARDSLGAGMISSKITVKGDVNGITVYGSTGEIFVEGHIGKRGIYGDAKDVVVYQRVHPRPKEKNKKDKFLGDDYGYQ